MDAEACCRIYALSLLTQIGKSNHERRMGMGLGKVDERVGKKEKAPENPF